MSAQGREGGEIVRARHMSTPCSHQISVDDHDETASCLSPRAALSIRIGPFDVPISPSGTPQREASPRRPGRGFGWSAPADVWAILKDPSSSILLTLRRSGETVDLPFVTRWVEKRSPDLVAELKAHAAWRSAFVGDTGGYGIREERIEDILNAGVVHFQGNSASGRPLLVFSASRYDASRFSAQLPALLVYSMDAALKCADESINCKQQVVWLFDLHNVSRYAPKPAQADILLTGSVDVTRSRLTHAQPALMPARQKEL